MEAFWASGATVIGSDGGDGAIEPEEVGADDAAVGFRDDAVDVGAGEEHGQEADGGLDGRDIGREVVLLGDGLEGVEADGAGAGASAGVPGRRVMDMEPPEKSMPWKT